MRVHPNSKILKFLVIEGQLEVYVRSQAMKGKANKELISLISDFLSIKKSDIELVRGHKSRMKTLLLKNCDFSGYKKKIEQLGTTD